MTSHSLPTLGPVCNRPTALTVEASKVGLCTSPEKCKVLTTNVWNDRTDIQDAGSDIEKVDDFCYLGSYISHNGSCE